jgi:hypothetical protein
MKIDIHISEDIHDSRESRHTASEETICRLM